jgi:multimeric flavodoxin WrbA
MKITVLNGSPKGTQSVTMQYVHFMQQQFPQHETKILNITQRIRKLEKNATAFQEVIDEVVASDGILWAFPLYTCLVHSDYKRFIELIWERDAQQAFEGKYAAALSTSIHFYDHTAHKYIHAICDDLNMKFIDAYSAAMRDLFNKGTQRSLRFFAGQMFDAIENQAITFKQYAPLAYQPMMYTPGDVASCVDPGRQKVLIITDAEHENTNEWKMVERFRAGLKKPVEVMNLHDLDMKGGCRGCMQCGYDNTCIWEGKDGYVEFYKSNVQTADVLIFAGTIKDRYLSYRWKSFFDRRFFNTHSPKLLGKQFGFLISGPLSQIPNLREVLEAFVELQHSHLIGIVTDEWGDSADLDAHIERLAAQSIQCAEQRYLKPQTFLGVGAMKIFRDEIWGPLRFVFQADHKYYKKHGFYDFPQRAYKVRLLNALGTIVMRIKGFRERFYTKELKPGMIRSFHKILSSQL